MSLAVPTDWGRFVNAANAFATVVAPVMSGFVFLPVRTAMVLGALVENDIAVGEADQISHRDTLWFQAGSGDDGISYRDGSKLESPKWSGDFPSIAGPLAAQSDLNAPDSHHFTFQIGR